MNVDSYAWDAYGQQGSDVGKRRRRARRQAARWSDAAGVDDAAVDEFFRFGGPSVFPCGCSAYEAVNISVERVGSDAYPIGTGLGISDIDEFRASIGEEPVIWWHACPQGENVVLRNPTEAG